MKKILPILLFVLSFSSFESYSKDYNTMDPNNTPQNTSRFDPSRILVSSSHTLKKKGSGYTTGDINVTIQNDSSEDIEEVEVVLKSSNQPSIVIATLDKIKRNGYQKTTGTHYITDIQYPYLVCSFTCNGKSYTREYSYYKF